MTALELPINYSLVHIFYHIIILKIPLLPLKNYFTIIIYHYYYFLPEMPFSVKITSGLKAMISAQTRWMYSSSSCRILEKSSSLVISRLVWSKQRECRTKGLNINFGSMSYSHSHRGSLTILRTLVLKTLSTLYANEETYNSITMMTENLESLTFCAEIFGSQSSFI